MKEKLVLSPKREKIMTRGQFNRRKKSIWVYVIGVFLATVGLVLSIVAVDRSIQSTSANTQFTQEELNQVREIIRDNVAERKRVTDEIDARVNAQSRVLCITIATFIDSAKQPDNVATLLKAYGDLKCSEILGPDIPTPTPTTVFPPETLPSVPPSASKTLTPSKTTPVPTMTRTVVVTPTTPVPPVPPKPPSPGPVPLPGPVPPIPDFGCLVGRCGMFPTLTPILIHPLPCSIIFCA